MLELAILGLLHERPLHGYEMKKRLAEALGPFAGASFGSLYPALRRLESTGAVRAVASREPASAGSPTATPMTGSLGGELAAFAARRRRLAVAITESVVEGAGRRNRRVYGITDRGRQQFTELLAAEPVAGGDDRAFAVKLAFAGHLPPPARRSLLERHRAQLVERSARTRAAVRTADAEGVDRYRRSIIEHGLRTTELDIAWLDELIEQEALANADASEGNTR